MDTSVADIHGWPAGYLGSMYILWLLLYSLYNGREGLEAELITNDQ